MWNIKQRVTNKTKKNKLIDCGYQRRKGVTGERAKQVKGVK